MQSILNEMIASGQLKKGAGEGYCLAQFELSEVQKQALETIAGVYRDSGMSIVSLTELDTDMEKRFALTKKETRMILGMLVEQGQIQYVEDIFISKDTIDNCRMSLLKTLSENDRGISVSEFRDLVNGNRRICLMLLGLYDHERIIRRDGDRRYITPAGKNFLSEVN